MKKQTVQLVDIKKLKPHEEPNMKNLHFLEAKMHKETEWIAPIVVEKQYYVILDGHHRYNVAQKLGFYRVPVYLIDYADPSILLDSWVDDMTISKEEVIRRGLEGKLFAPKTTRHMVTQDGQLQHIRDILPETQIPFSELIEKIS